MVALYSCRSYTRQVWAIPSLLTIKSRGLHPTTDRTVYGWKVDPLVLQSASRGLIGDTKFGVLPNISPQICFAVTIALNIVSRSQAKSQPCKVDILARYTWPNFYSCKRSPLNTFTNRLSYRPIHPSCLGGMYTKKVTTAKIVTIRAKSLQLQCYF